MAQLSKNKRPRLRIEVASLPLLLCLCVACGGPDAASQDNKDAGGSGVSIVVTSPSLYWIAASLTADWESGSPDVTPLYAASDLGQSEWFPDSQQLASLQAAKLVIINGAGVEPWLPMVTVSEDALVDTTVGVEDRLIPKPGSLVHQHGPRGSSNQRSWLAGQWHDPEIVKKQAQQVAQRLTMEWPAEKSAIESARQRLDDELLSLEKACRRVGRDLGEQIIADPSFGFAYLIRACGLKPLPLPSSPSSTDDPPSDDEAAETVQATLALTDDMAFQESGVAADPIVLDPIRSEGDKDFIARFRANLDALAGGNADSALQDRDEGNDE